MCNNLMLQAMPKYYGRIKKCILNHRVEVEVPILHSLQVCFSKRTLHSKVPSPPCSSSPSLGRCFYSLCPSGPWKNGKMTALQVHEKMASLQVEVQMAEARGSNGQNENCQKYFIVFSFISYSIFYFFIFFMFF